MYCIVPHCQQSTMARERRQRKRSLSGAEGDKSFRICSVLGGLDVTRYVSRDARSFFAGALDDVELIREVITETALNGGVGHRMTLAELNNTLDRHGRGYDNNETVQTTVDVSAATTYIPFLFSAFIFCSHHDVTYFKYAGWFGLC